MCVKFKCYALFPETTEPRPLCSLLNHQLTRMSGVELGFGAAVSELPANSCRSSAWAVPQDGWDSSGTTNPRAELADRGRCVRTSEGPLCSSFIHFSFVVSPKSQLKTQSRQTMLRSLREKGKEKLSTYILQTMGMAAGKQSWWSVVCWD